jgi:5-methylcytosine-specific restriction endonuclease McrA
VDKLNEIEPYKQVLKLNFDYNPIEICSWKKAIKLILKGRAHIIAKGVIRLLKYINLPYSKIVMARPSRNAILQRDGYSCQYCGTKSNLTIDHVVPTSKGGENTWENMVAACMSCNNKKGDKDVDKSGLKLKSTPRIPYNRIFIIIKQAKNEEWNRFIYS